MTTITLIEDGWSNPTKQGQYDLYITQVREAAAVREELRNGDDDIAGTQGCLLQSP